MSESLSKAAKKNLKRAERKAQQRAQQLKDDGVIDRLKEENRDPMANLKAQLQEAKTNKDHKLAAKLRKDIWVLQDQLAGQLPPGEDVEPIDILEESSAPENVVTDKDADENPAAQTEKKLRKLRKKLQQIQSLKSKQDEGEELDKCQIRKIQCEESVLQEINALEQFLKQQSEPLPEA